MTTNTNVTQDERIYQGDYFVADFDGRAALWLMTGYDASTEIITVWAWYADDHAADGWRVAYGGDMHVSAVPDAQLLTDDLLLALRFAPVAA